MTLRVLLFAAYREIVGEREMCLQVPEGTTADGLFSLLAQSHPRLASLRPSATFAVNRNVVAHDHRLQHGDEVAFIQPVSGG
ncbi:MAG: MoaD/ThiS family protein [Chloroflexota bacterium]